MASEPNITIRLEEPADYFAVENLTREAFWNLYCPGCEEHLIAHKLRESPDFIPELSFVLERDGEIVGSIFYSRAKVVDEQGNEHEVISFGPVSIAPRLHRQGLGRQLITHSINEARALGHDAIIIGGYPYHYEPYGFAGSKKYGIAMSDGNYYTGIMALPLREGALDDVCGRVFFSESMQTNEDELEEFDKQFPKKEKAVQESQAEFAKASAEPDTRSW